MFKALLELAYRQTLDGLDPADSGYPFAGWCRCEWSIFAGAAPKSGSRLIARAWPELKAP